MTVWIVERNHEPLIVNKRVVSFPADKDGTHDLKRYLGAVALRSPNDYFDGVLYARKTIRKEGK